MATQLPEKLKSTDLAKFYRRAAQLETVRPVIAYWCEYWIVNQIITNGLSDGDPECLEFTKTLMDKLEKVKSENATNDAFVDDMAGQAYVEQFGLETFVRAQRAVDANKVTRQTADTFQAAATFLELLNIWAPPDMETQAKIKYAKWNAVRIAKAIKEGKDPNDSNPKHEPAKEESLAELAPTNPDEDARAQFQPSVQDAADDDAVPESKPPAHEVSPPTPYEPYPRDGFPYTAVQDHNVSPLGTSPKDRNGSIGGGYFPEVPTFTSDAPESTLPTAPPEDTIDLGMPDASPLPPAGSARGPVGGFNYGDAPPTPHDNTPQFSPPPAPYQPPYQPPPPHHTQPPPPTSYTTHPPPPVQYYQQPAPAPATIPPTAQTYNGPLKTDDVSIAKAQKHARWAISALNFEDAETAVKELREALKTLGAA
ncbi:Vta1 like-domain-containing protein [Xylogone sp. PMI_703]|nr:Vta1 like-domain-containing protein [Xylogone sp. PMI_703]